MKRVFKSLYVLDVIQIPEVLKTLYKLVEALGKLQKALGEYLEHEQSSFPRFYFVGDEDLLKILGNSKDILRVVKHLKKILELQMQFSLAELLCKAVDELVTFYTQGESLDKAKFLAWIKSYPAQLVVLAIQIMWTQTINNALRNDTALSAPLQTVLRTLDLLAFVLGELDPVMRQKCEHLINELVHQRDALHSQLGGSPFGPAGTGKTESVKALGVQLGQFVLVFCCDETFDFQAMGRIFVRLCQVGAWGCFDKANRLEESILSAVSQQIQSIQQGLKAALVNPNAEVELVGKTLKINPHTHGIFITMNPGYAGRSNLPDNLKKLFRSMAMTLPDRELIAQVMLFSQGFRTAETLASKVVPFFSLCDEQLSKQPHYDSGLRALKAVLTSAGHLKRSQLQTSSSLAADSLSDSSNSRAEQEILVQSVTETTVPKLVADDIRETIGSQRAAGLKLGALEMAGTCEDSLVRHAPLVMVDYPGEASLKQIYGTFNRAALKVVPNLRGHAEPLTSAMVKFYLASQKRFTSDNQAHYIYSPRELTRWTRGIHQSIKPLETLSLEGLVRVWAHKALRLFPDRLVSEDEKRWTDEQIDAMAIQHFPSLDQSEALARPILFSNWTSKHCISVDRDQLRDYLKARLRVFYEEELDVPLVLFNNVLDHVLRINRVFHQVQGHLLLIGVSGSGKTTLSRFVAWMNGLSVFQIKVHNKYTADDLDDDLRNVLRRSGCEAEKICFIMDKSNVLDSGFLECMNTLLANAEVPGLFEGDEHAALMTAWAQRDGVVLDSPDELYQWFTQQVAKNLHVVFTMNQPENGLASRAATSPALFNRCMLDWFGDWSDQAFYQVGMEFTSSLDLDTSQYVPPANFPVVYRQLSLPPVHRTAIINALVAVHMSMYKTNRRLAH
ncbi:hypothetical protein PtA15_18A374 [Puccinia triticina]|uniref:AAA+ ATPase domain-containing protein n=1 Tax=Puccinia triticina TaxID=208348 RepID=A0ABY7D6M6_9BASI|nr:uncharacterized protein PtA15_18A374 [Puccinia triticina]WAQ93314.1 hypothetical protein PtA15_18A374 [Puccinia triticina]